MARIPCYQNSHRSISESRLIELTGTPKRCRDRISRLGKPVPLCPVFGKRPEFGLILTNSAPPAISRSIVSCWYCCLPLSRIKMFALYTAVAEILHHSDVPTVSLPISNAVSPVQSQPILRFRRTALRAFVSAGLCFVTSLPVLSADNTGSASLRIHINVVSMVNTSEASQKPGNLQMPSMSEVRVMENRRSDWFLQPAANRGESPNTKGATATELITTVIVPR